MHTYRNPNYVIIRWSGNEQTIVAAAEGIDAIYAAWGAILAKEKRYRTTMQQGARIMLTHEAGQLYGKSR